jgi:hypothetical protein
MNAAVIIFTITLVIEGLLILLGMWRDHRGER